MRTDTYFDERQLVLQVSKGNRTAFEKIYHFYKRDILNHLYYIFKSEELTHDIAQETFLSVWINRNAIDLEKSFKSYLYTIASNKAYDLLRKAKKDQKLFDALSAFTDEIEDQVYDQLFKKQRSEQLYDIMSKLPNQQRIVFQMAKIDGYSYEEIANILGISRHTVNTHIKRANTFIKSHILNNPELFLLVLTVAFEISFNS
ncbi:MAG: RNA polymerase sigma factor [Sphingobacterium sp.]|jgi:RNA polymerase sigma-70 factor (ECF subfamily)|nr:RNA polymerase sigma factor [Sphingobacterium sp.]